MQLFLDTTDVAVLKDLAATGLVDGVTTNPTLIAKSGRPMLEVIAEICDLVEGPVSAEVAATDTAGMLDEGRKLAADRPQRRGQGAADPRRPDRHPRVRPRGHPDQRHPVLLRRPGPARGQGGRDLHLARSSAGWTTTAPTAWT